jgi:hypothetical protein
MSKLFAALNKAGLLFILFVSFVFTAQAQTTVFTYQGRFTDTTVAQPTNGSYAMSYKLFDAVSGGNQVGLTVTLPSVQVVNGIFTVTLDYGAAAFDGAARFLEVTVVNTVLSPRQEITNAPYAITAQNALRADLANDSARLGGISANQYVTGQVVRSVNNLTDNVTLAAGSNITITPSGSTLTIASTSGGSFINNATILQPTSNFNISGNGTVGGTLSANIVNSATTYKIGNANVFGTPNATSVVAGQFSNFTLLGANSAFFGYKAGQATNGFSQANTFIGSEAGELTTSGGNNTFVGRDSGLSNTSGSLNSFFGSSAGQSNTTADANSFFGYESGFLNSTGTRNSYFGFQSGRQSATANDNSFFGYQAGNATTGGNNSFFGSLAGSATTTGNNNSFLGADAGKLNTSGFRNSFFGSGAGFENTVGFQNSFFGVLSGTNNTDGNRNSFFGDSAGFLNTTGFSNSFFGVTAGLSNVSGVNNSFFGTDAGRNNTADNNSFFGRSAGLANTGGTRNVFFGLDAGRFNIGGGGNSFVGTSAGSNNTTGANNTAVGDSANFNATNLTFASAIGAGATVSTSNTVVLGRPVDLVLAPNLLQVNTLGAAGSTSLCRNAALQISTCTPGNIAEPQNKESLNELRTQNLQMLEQLKAQQAQIAEQTEKGKQQQTQLQQQQLMIDGLQKLVCAQNPQAEVCKEQK